MVMGEYSILEPNYKSIVMAIDRYVYANIEESSHNQVVLTDFNLKLNWQWQNETIKLTPDDPRINFVENAMNIVGQYLREQEIMIDHFSLTIHSELDDKSGIKYGLGSSAAVVTAVITAILTKYLPHTPAKELIFKLASIAHVITQKNGSGADIAASTYGGVLLYSAFQAEWLLNAYEQSASITNLIDDNWPYFSLHQIEFPKKLEICVGWTGKPASTGNLVQKILRYQRVFPEEYGQFLYSSKLSLKKILQGIAENDLDLIFKGIQGARLSLYSLGVVSGTNIETPLLKKLSDLSDEFGGAGKLSGAGGGDCGIALMPTKEAANKLIQEWEKAGIKPLDLAISQEGASIV